MKILHVDDLDKFFRTIDECTGRIELASANGDLRLNLKSKLAQYFALAKVFSGGAEVSELEILTYNQEDANRLIQYMVG